MVVGIQKEGEVGKSCEDRAHNARGYLRFSMARGVATYETVIDSCRRSWNPQLESNHPWGTTTNGAPRAGLLPIYALSPARCYFFLHHARSQPLFQRPKVKEFKLWWYILWTEPRRL